MSASSGLIAVLEFGLLAFPVCLYVTWLMLVVRRSYFAVRFSFFIFFSLAQDAGSRTGIKVLCILFCNFGILIPLLMSTTFKF